MQPSYNACTDDDAEAKEILTAVLNTGLGEDAAEEGQSNAVQQPGAEDKDGCFPIYTLQYISSGEQLARHVTTHRGCTFSDGNIRTVLIESSE